MKWYLKHPHKILCFKDLPQSHQLALIQWMAIDGYAWEIFYAKKALPYHISFVMKKHGDEKFGVVDIPTKALCQRIHKKFDDTDKADWKSFEDYHKWYMTCFEVCKHPIVNRWPCILATSDDEERFGTLNDGYHRFHWYIEQNAKVIPCVFFP